MNKTNDMDNHCKADTVIDFHAFADKENTLLPNDVSLADCEHSQSDALSTGEYETAEYTSDSLEYAGPDMPPPDEDSADSGDSIAQDSDRLHRPIWALPPEDRSATLLAALDKAQLEIERQAKRNRELNTRMHEINRLAGQPEGRASDSTADNAKLRGRLDDGEDYLQALTAQTGRLDTILDSLAQLDTGVAELNAALDEDLTGCDELASKMKADEGRLAELESLIDQHCGAGPSGNETRKNAVAAEPAQVDYLETLTKMNASDLDKPTAVQVKRRELDGEVEADNHLFIEMSDAIKCPLDKSVVTIGRGRFNDIQVRARCVSRSHARIVTNDSDAVIEDLDSKNGITVNGQTVKLRQLKDGDIVEVDKIWFKFVDLMADERKQDRRAADAPAADSSLAADEGDKTSLEMRDRRNRRNRRQAARELEQLKRQCDQDSTPDAEKQPEPDTQSSKKPWWKFRE